MGATEPAIVETAVAANLDWTEPQPAQSLAFGLNTAPQPGQTLISTVELRKTLSNLSCTQI